MVSFFFVFHFVHKKPSLFFVWIFFSCIFLSQLLMSCCACIFTGLCRVKTRFVCWYMHCGKNIVPLRNKNSPLWNDMKVIVKNINKWFSQHCSSYNAIAIATMLNNNPWYDITRPLLNPCHFLHNLTKYVLM